MSCFSLSRKAVLPFLVVLFLPLNLHSDSGYLVKIDSATVYVDLNEAAGAIAGRSFEVYRDGEELRHPVTGASLGRMENKLTRGRITEVRPAFSVGQVEDGAAALKAGDRVRWAGPPPQISLETLPAAVPATPSISALLPLLWKSDALRMETNRIGLWDPREGGMGKVVIADANQVQIYQSSGTVLVPGEAWKSKGGGILGMEVVDLAEAGGKGILVNQVSVGDRPFPETYLLEMKGQSLEPAARGDAFVRTIRGLDGKMAFVGQEIPRYDTLSFLEMRRYDLKDGKFIPGAAWETKGFRFDGWTYADLEGKGTAEPVYFDTSDCLRIGTGEQKWVSDDRFGGTTLRVLWRGEPEWIRGRILVYRPAGSKKDRLVVAYNVPFMRTSRLRIYHQSEIRVLEWDGTVLQTVAKRPLDGYCADIALTSDASGRPAVLAAVVGKNKRTLLQLIGLP